MTFLVIRVELSKSRVPFFLFEVVKELQNLDCYILESSIVHFVTILDIAAMKNAMESIGIATPF